MTASRQHQQDQIARELVWLLLAGTAASATTRSLKLHPLIGLGLVAGASQLVAPTISRRLRQLGH